MTAQSTPAPVELLPAHARRARITQWAIGIGVIAVAVTFVLTMPNVSWERVARGVQNSGPLFRAFMNPDGRLFELALERMLESLYMAVLGTGMGAALAFPISFLAAANLMGGRVLSSPGKAVLVAVRTFPELLLAIIFVASFGPGALAGIMAIGIHSIGFLGKIFSDVIEGIDPGPIEALKATGAHPAHVFIFAVLPQVLPEFASNVLYRFEINLRSSSTLGLVGAGGVGVLLVQRIQFRRWEEISMILIVIVVFVIVVDTISGYIRRRLV